MKKQNPKKKKTSKNKFRIDVKEIDRKAFENFGKKSQTTDSNATDNKAGD